MVSITKQHVLANFRTPKHKREPKLPAHKTRPGMSADHLALVRALPCLVAGCTQPSQAHHLLSTGERGAGLRSTDKWAVPLCNEHHINGVHRVGSRRELAWFRENGIADPMLVAERLWKATGCLDRMQRVLSMYR